MCEAYLLVIICVRALWRNATVSVTVTVSVNDNSILKTSLDSRVSLKSQVVLLQTAHSWANAGVLLGARMHRERVAFETIKVSGLS